MVGAEIQHSSALNLRLSQDIFDSTDLQLWYGYENVQVADALRLLADYLFKFIDRLLTR